MLRPITSPDALLTVLRKLKAQKVTPAVCDQINDPATPWRLFYTFYSQAGGKVLADNGKRVVLDRALSLRVLGFIDQLAQEGLMNSNTDAGGGVAHLLGRHRRSLLGGGVERRRLPDRRSCRSACSRSRPCSAPDAVQADSHTFVMPKQPSADPERTEMILTLMRSLLGQSLIWAEGGHIPAWLPVGDSAAYRKLKPQSNYASVADHVVYDPPAWYSGSGSNLENYAGGAIAGVMTGATTPAAAYDEMHSALVSLSTQSDPV